VDGLGNRKATSSPDTAAYARGFDTHGRLVNYPLAGTTRALTYDALDRLTSASLGGVSHAWGYDATGNRVSRGIGAASYAYTVQAGSNRSAPQKPIRPALVRLTARSAKPAHPRCPPPHTATHRALAARRGCARRGR
jgi:YD repeat-containing protein